MSDVSGSVDIRLTDNVTPNTRKINNSLSSIETKSKSAFGSMVQSSQRADAQLQKTSAQMNNTRIQSLGMATSIAGLGASFVALETTMTNIPKRLNAIAKAETALARVEDLVSNKTLALQKAELALDKARSGGKKTAAEIGIIEQKITNIKTQLGTATKDLADKTEDLNLKNADYADTLKLMATSIFTTFLTAGSSVMIMLTNMATATDMSTGAFVRSKLAVLSHSATLKFLRIDLGAASLAVRGFAVSTTAIGTTTLVATTGIKRLSLGIKGLFVAMGPIGWVIIGITAAMEAWNSNFLGVQNHANNLSKIIEVRLAPILGGLAEIIGFLTGSTVELNGSFQSLNDEFLFPPVHAEMEKADKSTKQLTEDVAGLGSALATESESLGAFGDDVESVTGNIESLSTALDPNGTDAFNGFGKSVDQAKQKLLPFVNGIFDAKGNVVDLNDRVDNANNVYLAWGRALSGVNREYQIQNGILDKNTGKLIENTKAAKENLETNLKKTTMRY